MSGRKKKTRTRLPWVSNRQEELEASGGGGRRYRIEDNDGDYLMKGLMGSVQFRAGPFGSRDEAVQVAEELEQKFDDRPKDHYRRRGEKI